MPAESTPPGLPSDANLEELLNAFIVGELDEVGRDALLKRLAEDPAAREIYGTMVEMEAMLHHEFPRFPDAREVASSVRRAEFPQRPKTSVRKRSVVPLIWGAAAALVLAAGAWWFWKPDARPVLADAYGEWSWQDSMGEKKRLTKGEPVPEVGLLMTESSGSYAKLVFPDQSTAILSGVGELRLPREKAKRLMLGRGNLEVEMKPQPIGKPASIETFTAKVEVVGTRFSVDANLASTTVAVSEGKVKLSRLADGKTVDIPRDRMATASLDSGMKLETRMFSAAPADWKMLGNFTAKPFRAGGSDTQPFIHYGVDFKNEGDRVFDGLLELQRDSRIRVKFRVADPRAMLRVFMVCREKSGQFGGNRQEQFRVSDLAADADGWRIYERDVHEMGVLTPTSGFEIDGKRLAHLSISVLKASDQLEISGVEIGN